MRGSDALYNHQAIFADVLLFVFLALRGAGWYFGVFFRKKKMGSYEAGNVVYVYVTAESFTF